MHCCLLLNPIVQKKTGPSGGKYLQMFSPAPPDGENEHTTRGKRDEICAFLPPFQWRFPQPMLTPLKFNMDT